jgi:hypothetical protein
MNAATIIANQSCLLAVALIGITALAVNLPLGYIREGKRKFSAQWFVYVHLSIPLVAWLRISNHLSLWYIPPFIGCAVLGQLAGGRMRRSRRDEA